MARGVAQESGSDVHQHKQALKDLEAKLVVRHTIVWYRAQMACERMFVLERNQADTDDVFYRHVVQWSKLFSTALLGSIVNRSYLSRSHCAAARSIVAMPLSLFQ